MSRQIKFRVWDIDQKRYLSTKEGANYQLYPTYEECVERERGRGIGFRPLGWCIKQPERFTVEQFTGLLDLGGREIYEGDIVGNEYMDPRLVQFGPFEDSDGYEVIGWHTGLGWLESNPSIRVLGNIHENPELLKL